jgi:hypothetical protein
MRSTHGTLTTTVTSSSSSSSSSSVASSSSGVQTRFGIREVVSTLDSNTNGVCFTVNRVKVFLQGGNWIGTDQLLRFSTDAERYQSEVGSIIIIIILLLLAPAIISACLQSVLHLFVDIADGGSAYL